MRITILAIGRAKAGPVRDLYTHYAARMAQGQAKSQFGAITLKEVEERRPLPPPEMMAREGELLLAAVPQGAQIVALDEAGKSLSSSEFAAQLGKWQDDGLADLCFVIGGADGLAPAVREAADLVLSLGAVTWPHMLVRGLLAEQLYRAQSILSGHPYHRG